jgi:hypothetical protein
VNEYNAKTYKRQGNSQGCFAVANNEIKKVIHILEGGAAFIMAVSNMALNTGTLATTPASSKPSSNIGR